MKILVVGASGFVGGYLIRELEAAGHRTFQANLPEVNLLDSQKIRETIRNVRPDGVVNLAAISSVGASWKDPSMTMDVNVKGTLHLLDAIQEFVPDCKTLLIGSAEEYAPKSSPLSESDPLSASNPYGISKIAQENFAALYRKKYGMKIVCTRSFNHTGIGQSTRFAIPSFCAQAASIDRAGIPGTISVGDLSVYRDFSDVRDVVRVYRHLMESENKFDVYNVGSGIAYKLSDLLNDIISLSKTPIEIVRDESKVRPIDIPYLCCDNSKVKDCFPATDIHKTIQEMFLHFKGIQ